MKKILVLITIVILSGFAFAAYHSQVDKYINLAKEKTKKYDSRRKDYVIVIDYSKPISAKRLFVIDLKNNIVVLEDYVSHSLLSGSIYANELSNVSGSNMSIDGVFLTQEKYQGQYGEALRIKGLDEKNKNTRSRNIVFHKMILIPYSLGCFATPESTNNYIVNNLNNGCLVVVIK
jgi:hypothetical protein